MSEISVSLASPQAEVVQGRAVVAVSVTLGPARPERVVLGVFRPLTVPGAPPAADPAWAVVERPLREMVAGATEQVVVTFAPPPGTPAGTYDAKVIAYPADAAPEEYAERGQVLRLVIPATPAPPAPRRSRWRLWVAAAVVLLTAIGVVTYVLTRPEPAPEPEATTARPPVSVEAATIPVGPWPAGIAIEPGTGLVYVTSRDGWIVSVIDPEVRAVVQELGTGQGPIGVAADPSNGLVYTADQGNGTVTAIDIASGGAFAQTDVGGSPFGLAVEPSTHRVWATLEDGRLAVVAISAAGLEDTVAVGAAPRGIAWNEVDGRFYVANQGDGTVSVVDPSARAVVATIDVGPNPAGVAVDPRSGRVLVTNQLGDSVSIIDADGGVGSVAVGINPVAVAVDPEAGAAYVVNSDATISVIDLAQDVVVDTIPVGGTPTAVAVDPGTGVVYVTNAADSTVSVLEAD